MTASRLRHAAAAMREQNIPGRGYMDDTFLAVADWLDMCAGCVENYGPNAESPWVRPHTQMALAVANAYMQADAKADAR